MCEKNCKETSVADGKGGVEMKFETVRGRVICKDFKFYYKWDGKSMESFEQKIYMISFIF